MMKNFLNNIEKKLYIYGKFINLLEKVSSDKVSITYYSTQFELFVE